MRISPTEVITAQHVVGFAQRVNVGISGGLLQSATVTGYDSFRDLALLTLDSPAPGPVAEVPQSNQVIRDLSARSVADIGSQIALVGFVPDISTSTPIATFGRVGGLWSSLPGALRYGQVDAAATNGMSGGAVFNRYAEFLGILVTASNFDGNIRYLRFEEINAVLDDLRLGSKR